MSLIKKLVVDKITYFYDAHKNSLIKTNRYYSSDVKSLNIKPWISNDEYKWMLENCREQLVLSVTDSCNMRCKYCTYHNDRYQKKYNYKIMDEATAKMAINEFLSCCKETDAPCISFYGGEPLLNFKLIKECVIFALNKSYGKNIRFGITTNGLLINDEICDFFIKYNFEVGISLDGPKVLNDRYRLTINGKGTYKTIINNIINLYKKNKDYMENNVFLSTVLAPPKYSKLLFDFFQNSDISTVMSDVSINDHFKNLFLRNVDSISEDLEYANIENYDKIFSYMAIGLKKFYTVSSSVENESLFPLGFCNALVKKCMCPLKGIIISVKKWMNPIWKT